MELNKIYTQLTNVDIEKQKQLWDERGKGYYGEYLLFCELYRYIDGTNKILMNLNIPVNESTTTEIDLLMIHETGIYVFEIKHYKGTIYGKDTDRHWTQYFRTAKNNTFNNPIKQNEYHIAALKKLFPDLPIKSEIVFTNEDCDIRVTSSDSETDICLLKDVYRILNKNFQNTENILTMDEIDNIFLKLSSYSQMKEPIAIDGESAPFFAWVQPTITKLEEKKSEIKKEIKKTKKAKKNGVLSNIAIGILSVVLSFVVIFSFHKGYNTAIQNNTNKLEKFKQNFLHVDEINNEYIDTLDSYIEISDVMLSPLTDDAVSFSATLNMLNETYGIIIQKDSKYIVMTNSGKIYEYDMFGESLRYNSFSNILGKGYQMSGKLSETQFYGIYDPDEITYIKITNIKLVELGVVRTDIKDGLEIELYSK